MYDMIYLEPIASLWYPCCGCLFSLPMFYGLGQGRMYRITNIYLLCCSFFFSQTCKRAVYHTLLLIQIMCAGTWELRLNIFVYELFRLSFVLVNVMAINCYFMEEGRSTSILSFLFVSKMSMHWFSLIPCVVLTVWHLVSYFLTSNCFWTTIMLKKFQTCM